MSDVEPELVIEGVAEAIRRAFSFLVTDHGFREARVHHGMFSAVWYERGETTICVGWDLRENQLDVDVWRDVPEGVPFRERDRRVLLAELVALDGGRLADIVTAPHVVTREIVEPALESLADQLRAHGGSLLEDDWGGDRRAGPCAGRVRLLADGLDGGKQGPARVVIARFAAVRLALRPPRG